MSRKREAAVELKIGNDGRYRIHLIGANYEIMFSGEGYNTAQSAKRAVRRIAELMATAPIRVVV